MCREIVLLFVAAMCLAQEVDVGVQTPTDATVQAVPVQMATTEGDAWKFAWRSWYEQRIARGAAGDEGVREQILSDMGRVSEAGQVTALSGVAMAGILLANRLYNTPVGQSTGMRIALAVVKQPVHDTVRSGVTGGRAVRLMSNADVISAAMELADRCGGPKTDMSLYQQLIHGDVWRADASVKRIIERRYVQDKTISMLWISRMLREKPETWSQETMRAVLHPEHATGDEREMVLEQLIGHAIEHVEDVSSIELRARILFDVGYSAMGHWDNLLSDKALNAILDASAQLDDARMASVPYVILLHADVGKIKGSLSRIASRVLSLSSSVAPEAEVMFKLQDQASRQPWTCAVSSLPLTVVPCDLDATLLTAIAAYQRRGMRTDSPVYEAPKEVPCSILASKAVHISIIAQNAHRLTAWWMNTDAVMDIERDRMLYGVLSPWAFKHQILGPWWNAPRVNGVAPRLQYAVIARSGMTKDAMEWLKTSIEEPKGEYQYHRQLAWMSAMANDQLRSEYGPAIARLIPSELRVHPITRKVSVDDAIRIIDMHRQVGNDGIARTMARQVARLQADHGSQSVAPITDKSVEAPVPWTWAALQARLLVLDASEPHLASTIANIHNDSSAMGIFGSWVLRVASGEDPGECPVDAYVTAARDPRFPAVLATLGVFPKQAYRHVLALSDPRIFRGWCSGPPGAGWLSSSLPSEGPIIDVLLTLLQIRLLGA
jgi:hypothetical protein